jgi:hypothetical protein
MKKQQKIKEWRFQGGQPCTAISVFDVILDPLCVSVDDDFGEHLGMVAVSTAAGIGTRKDSVVQTG